MLHMAPHLTVVAVLVAPASLSAQTPKLSSGLRASVYRPRVHNMITLRNPKALRSTKFLPWLLPTSYQATRFGTALIPKRGHARGIFYAQVTSHCATQYVNLMLVLSYTHINRFAHTNTQACHGNRTGSRLSITSNYKTPPPALPSQAAVIGR